MDWADLIRGSPQWARGFRASCEGRRDLDHGLNNRESRQVAVIVNDMSKVNIDADLIREGAEQFRVEDQALAKRR